MTTYVETPDDIEAGKEHGEGGEEAERVAPAGRWRWLAVGLLTVFLMAAAGFCGWWLGSSGDTTDTPEIVEQWENAWRSGDPDAVAALYAPDAIWWDKTEEDDLIEGRQAIRNNAAFIFGWMTLDDFDNHTIIVDDRVVIVESTWAGEAYPRSDFDRAPYTAETVTVFEVEDGLITRSNIYVDLEDIFD